MITPRRRLVAGAFALILSIPAIADAQDDLFRLAPVVPTIQPAAVLKGHEKYIRGVAFSPDGKRIASAGDDAAILWDATTGKQIRHLAHKDAGRGDSYSVAFSPDGTTLAVGGYFGDVFLYDATTGDPRGKLDEPSLAVDCLAYSPNGSVLAASHDDKEVMIFDVKDSKLLGTIKPSRGNIRWFAFSADGKTLASITNEELATWDVETRKPLKSLPLPQQRVDWAYTAVACSPRSSTVVATGGWLIEPKTIAYDLKTLQPKGGLSTFPADPGITNLSFSPDGKVLASAGGGIGNMQVITLWDVSTGDRFAELVCQSEASLTQAVFSPDGGRVVASGLDKMVRIWTVKAGNGAGATKGKPKGKRAGR
jgi:WD40 repeat protein